MAKVTSKFQVTIPKALASEYGIEPGDDIEWSASGDAIRLSRAVRSGGNDLTARLRLFDKATLRQKAREKTKKRDGEGVPADRGWTRDALYDRGRSR